MHHIIYNKGKKKNNTHIHTKNIIQKDIKTKIKLTHPPRSLA